MHLELELSAARGSLEAWSKSKHRETAGVTDRLNFVAAPEGHQRLELKTGEILQAPFWRKKDAQALEVFVNVYRSELPEPDAVGQLLYLKGYESRDGSESSPGSIFFELRVPSEVFEKVVQRTLANHAPKSVSLDFPNDAFTFGWEPDGSCMKWDNEQARTVAINSARFDFRYAAQKKEDDTADETFNREEFEDPARASHALHQKLISLEKSTRTFLGWILFALAVLIWFARK